MIKACFPRSDYEWRTTESLESEEDRHAAIAHNLEGAMSLIISNDLVPPRLRKITAADIASKRCTCRLFLLVNSICQDIAAGKI